MGVRFIKGIKNPGTVAAQYKAIYVVQGHRDKEKHMFVHTCATLRHQSLRLILSIAATFSLDVWMRDITQAYVQRNFLSRQVFLRPEPTFDLPEGSLLQVFRPLYGLSDAGYAWWARIREFFTSSLYLLQTTGDPCLMYGDLPPNPSLLGVYVDDIIFAVMVGMVRSSDIIARRFPSKDLQEPPFNFASAEIEKTEYGFRLHQSPMLLSRHHSPQSHLSKTSYGSAIS